MKQLLALGLLLLGLLLALRLGAPDESGAVAPGDTGSERSVPDAGMLAEYDGEQLAEPDADSKRESLQQQADESDALAIDEPSVDVALIVATRESYGQGAQSVSGLEVQLGVSIGDDAWKGPLGVNKRLLLEARTNEQGLVEVVLPVPAALLARSQTEVVRLWGSVSEAGWKQWPKELGIPSEQARARELSLIARRGGTLYGHVLLSDGTPASSGKVFLCHPWTHNGSPDIEARGSLSADGGFALDFEESASFDLHASVPHAGAVTREDLQLVVGAAPYVELQLVGSGVVSGRVLDAAGAPFPNYPLWIFPPQSGTDVGYFSAPQKVGLQWSGGLADDYVVSDELGRFRFEGLRQGSYAIRGFTPSSGYYEEWLTPRVVTTDAHGLELIAPGYRLLLHVMHPAGKPLQDLDLAHRPKDSLARPHALYCEESDASGRLLAAERYMHERRTRLANGAVVLDVEPGKSYVVGVVSRGFRLAEQLIHIPADRPSGEHTLQLLPAREPATLVVNVLDPKGEPFTAANQVEIYAPDSGRLLLETDSYNEQSRFEVELGAGTYLVRVSAEPQRGHHGERFSATPHRPTERLVQVLPGRENVHDFQLGSNGVLEIAITCAVELPAVDFDESLGWEEALRLTNHGAALKLIAKHGGKTWRPAFGLGSAAELEGELLPWGTVEQPWVPIGKSASTVTPLPPGDYRLFLDPPGFRRFEREVTIEAQGTAKLEFHLTAEDRRD